MLHLLSHCLAAGISIRDSGVSRFDVLGEQLNLIYSGGSPGMRRGSYP